MWVDHCCSAFFLLTLLISLSLSFFHTHTHWLSLGSRLQRGYWGCGPAGCVMQCSGSHAFPGKFTGVFQPDYASSWRARTAHPKHSHVLEQLFCFSSATMHDQEDFFSFFFFIALLHQKQSMSQPNINNIQ